MLLKINAMLDQLEKERGVRPYLVNQGCERMSSRRIRAAGERLRQPRMRSWASEDTEEEGAVASGKAILASQIWGDMTYPVKTVKGNSQGD